MSHPRDMCKKYCRSASLALVFLLSSWTLGLAQDPGRLPDSVQVADSARSPADEPGAATNPSFGQQSDHNAAVPVDDSLTYRFVPDSARRAYVHDKDFAYANDPAYWAPNTDNGEKKIFDYIFSWLFSKWFRGFLYLCLGAILIFALYKIIVEQKLYLFYAPARKTMPTQTEDRQGDPANLDALIEKAVQISDFRSAVRWLHLKAIRVAGENGWIDVQPKATNRHYLLQLAQNPAHDGFQFLTQAYERVWFGGFNLTQEQYQKLRVQFEQFFKMSKS
jgi:Domain of unknown function (DUF4129)